MPSEGDYENDPTHDISRGVVAIYKDHTGRGPTDARTEFTATSAVTTVSGSLTKAEHMLVASGRVALVREMRRTFQEAMADITNLVETATGRECGTFLSDHDTESDVAVEMVVFKTSVASSSKAWSSADVRPDVAAEVVTRTTDSD